MINGISIRAKSWGYEETDCPTGNYEITHTIYSGDDFHKEDVNETVSIDRMGKVLRDIVERNGISATDEQIEQTWNHWIDRHNENFKDFFIHKFSKVHKQSFESLTGGYRGFFYFEPSMVVQVTPKAVRIDHPIVGSQWIPKSQLFMYRERHFIDRHHLSWEDGWLNASSDALVISGYESYLQKKHRAQARLGEPPRERFTTLTLGGLANTPNSQLVLEEHPFEIYVRRWSCNQWDLTGK